MVLPIGSREGGTNAGMTVTVGMKPLLSAATGTSHDMVAEASPGSVATSMLAGQSMLGGLTSGYEIIAYVFIWAARFQGLIILLC